MPLLNDADAAYMGTTKAKRIYRGSTLVWEDWNVATPGGLRIHLDAADYTPGSWPNRVASGATPTFVGTPLPIKADGVLNGRPVVRFAFNEARLRLYGSGVTTNWTLAYVARMLPGPAYGRILNGIYPPANILFGWWNGFQDVAYDNGFMDPNTQASVVPNVWKMYSADGSTLEGPQPMTRFFGDGVLKGTWTSGQGWSGRLGINGYDPDNIQETCNSEVAEVILYDKRLPDVDRQAVEAYLRTKWGLA